MLVGFSRRSRRAGRALHRRRTLFLLTLVVLAGSAVGGSHGFGVPRSVAPASFVRLCSNPAARASSRASRFAVTSGVVAVDSVRPEPAGHRRRLRPDRPRKRVQAADEQRRRGRPSRSSTPTTTRTRRATSPPTGSQFGLPACTTATAASARSTRTGRRARSGGELRLGG